MRLMYANHITSRVLNQAFAVGDGIRITEVGTTGLTGKCSAWNMNTAAPLTAFGQTFHGNVWQFGQVFQSIAPYNQFVISVNGGGTINAGTVYVQSYKRTNVVEPYDFTASPVTEWDLTGLKKKSDSAIVLSAYDLTMSVSDPIVAEVSTDGVTFDTGATDYLLSYFHKSADAAVQTSSMQIGQTGGTSMGMCSLILGVPLLTRSAAISNDIRVQTDNAILNMTTREARQTEKTLRVKSGTGATINGGTGYAVRYKL
jgi:hypothetical protein